MAEITPIGITNYRNTGLKFGIKDKDRLQHLYVLGRSGSGKSTLLLNMALSDINRGNGICVIDPHGTLATAIMEKTPEKRKKDVQFLNPQDLGSKLTFNPLHKIHPDYHHLVASGLVSTFKKIWHESWGPRMEHILRFSVLTLLCYPDATLLDIQPLLTSRDFRQSVLQYVLDEHIRSFWEREFEPLSPKMRTEVISPILNKVGIFRASKPLLKVFGSQGRGLRITELMDNRKILICNLSKGELGEDASSLLGCMLLTSLQMAGLFRSRMSEAKRTPFYIYVDEMQSYVTMSFVDILSEARKFGLSLFLTHQYLDQLDEPIRKAIFGNVGTTIAFRVGAHDAEFLSQEFYPPFTSEDLINLPRYHIYIKLMIDGTASEPFSAVTIPT